MPYDQKTIEEHGLTNDEFAKICEIMGREPTYVELGVFSVMWSEHCSYKSSRVHLKKLPTKGRQVICGPGENAGVVDIGDGLCAVFKMESHNHPSFIEPYQGAATGVGGIMRDVFTMGARPVALLDNLRFGDIKKTKTRSLIHGVVAGIAGYGNCMGVPTVGGETRFDSSFNGNNLVNAFCVGIARQDKIFLAQAAGIGNPVIYLGSKTGRDGIHGATMASAEFDEDSEEKRPTVQVGDPFTEKRLLEACLELMAGGDIIGIQDMGAAGLTCSSLEMAGSGGVGIELNLDNVPCREEGMSAYEIMLSESQERMLLVAKKGSEKRVKQIFEKWDLDAAVVGKIVKGDQVTVRHQGKIVAQLPTRPITDQAPLYRRPSQQPKYLKKTNNLSLNSLKQPTDWNRILLKLMASSNLSSKSWIYQQYDHMVGTDTVLLPGSDAAVIRIKKPAGVKGTERGLALSTDCNSRYCYLDPYWGAYHAVCEAARNIVCSGGRPLATTDCLNFGNPENPEIMWQFEQAIAGMRDACRALNTPIVSGNVSFYNETFGQGIDPTPSVAMVGLLKNVKRHCQQGFQQAGDEILLLGGGQPELGGSEYLFCQFGKKTGRPPQVDIEAEKKVQEVVRRLIEKGWLASAHDLSDGGLAVALVESALAGETRHGFKVSLPGKGRLDQRLFGESASRILVSLEPKKRSQVIKFAKQHRCPVERLGIVGGDRVLIGKAIALPLQKVAKQWSYAFKKCVA